jgi:hypothetical protein
VHIHLHAGLAGWLSKQKTSGNYLEQHAGWLSTISDISREYIIIIGFCLIGCLVIVIMQVTSFKGRHACGFPTNQNL